MRNVILLLLIVAILIAVVNACLAFCFPTVESSTLVLCLATVSSIAPTGNSLPDSSPEIVRPRYKITMEEQRLLYEILCQTPFIPSQQLLVEYENKISIAQIEFEKYIQSG